MREFNVAIIGAGLGRLALGQALKREGVAFNIFERDHAPDSRLQGYRIRIDSEGQRALSNVLPDKLYELFKQTASIAANAGRFLTPQLENISRRVPESWHTDDEEADLSVNRQTLREILMSGIEEYIHFGHSFESYSISDDGCVKVIFEQESFVLCDLIVGADGVNSRVRSQLVPSAEPIDTGSICIYGKVELEKHHRIPKVYDGTSIIFADGYSVILDEMRFHDALLEVAKNSLPESLLTPINDYRYWAFIGPRSQFGLDNIDSNNVTALQAQAHDIVVSHTLNWHPELKEIFQQSKASDIAMLPIRCGRANIEWLAGPVTLLGDAIHAMSPAGGVGANTVLKDASALAGAITHMARKIIVGFTPLIDYEKAMREWAAQAIAASNDGETKLFGF